MFLLVAYTHCLRSMGLIESTVKKLFLIILLTSCMNTAAQSLVVKSKLNFLALGDSYTIGESVPENERWPVQLVELLRKRGFQCDDPTIIATTGWRTDELKKAIIQANLPQNFNLVSLLIGVNNQYQGKSVESYKPEFEELLKMAIQFAGGDTSKVFVVSIPDYGFTPFGKEKQAQISKALDEFNGINRSIAEKYHVKYFYITDISRRGLIETDLVAPDGLHPSGKMYSEWVERILADVKIR
jgi:lysophospholipase L1-like esterase